MTSTQTYIKYKSIFLIIILISKSIINYIPVKKDYLKQRTNIIKTNKINKEKFIKYNTYNIYMNNFTGFKNSNTFIMLLIYRLTDRTIVAVI